RRLPPVLLARRPRPPRPTLFPYTTLFRSLPTQGNTHEIARGSRVVYIDNDPVVCAHGRALLARGENVEFLQADARKPDELLEALDRKSTRLNSSHVKISYAVFCLKKKQTT